MESSGHTGAAQDFAGTRTGSLWLSRTLWRRERATGLEGSGDVVMLLRGSGFGVINRS